MTRFLVLALSLLLPTVLHLPGMGEARAELIINGTFDTGTLAGWSTFVTSNGAVLSPGVTSFDVDGDGVASPAASFNAGQVSFSQIPAGGGISQFVMVPELNLYQFSADVAASTKRRAKAKAWRTGGSLKGLKEGTPPILTDIPPAA